MSSGTPWHMNTQKRGVGTLLLAFALASTFRNRAGLAADSEISLPPGTTFGTHTPGPTWTAAEGSSITADGALPLANVKRATGVPALLLTVTSMTGTRVLNGVRYVERADTAGGFAPRTDCDAVHENLKIAKHYSAGIYTVVAAALNLASSARIACARTTVVSVA